MVPSDPDYQFDMSGGALCLAFVNTIGDRPRCAEEHLSNWRDLLSWGEQAGLLPEGEAERLRAASPARARAMDRAFTKVLALRERLYGIFTAVAAGGPPSPADLAALNAELGQALARGRVDMRGGAFVWGWTDDGTAFQRIVRPVVRSAGELLTSPERADVRECASDVCSWLFIDRSRTHRRRWCSMKTCGNRDKARRFYERKHARS